MRRGLTARIGIPGRAMVSPLRSTVRMRHPAASVCFSWKEIAAYLKRDIRTAQRWRSSRACRFTATSTTSAARRTPIRARSIGGSRPARFASQHQRSRQPASRSHRRGDVPHANAPLRGAHRRAPHVDTGLRGVRAMVGSSGGSKLTTLSVVFPAEERFQDWGPDIALSPDGQTIAGRGPLTLRRLDQLEGKTLAEPSAALMPFFSADGGLIGFGANYPASRPAAASRWISRMSTSTLSASPTGVHMARSCTRSSGWMDCTACSASRRRRTALRDRRARWSTGDGAG